MIEESGKLRRFLGLSTTADLKAWMEGELFKPYFDELFEAHIRPAQEHANATKEPRPRGPDLKLVETQLLYGGKAGKRNYSKARVDKTGWNALDHFARFLFFVH